MRTPKQKLDIFYWAALVVLAIALTVVLKMGNTQKDGTGTQLPQHQTATTKPPYQIGWSVAQSASAPIGGGMYQVMWMQSKSDDTGTKTTVYQMQGTALTSNDKIRVGERIWIDQHLINSQPFYIITDWKPSGVTSW